MMNQKRKIQKIVLRAKKDSEYVKSSEKDEDTENSFESKKDSEYVKSSEKDESVNDDKKEL